MSLMYVFLGGVAALLVLMVFSLFLKQNPKPLQAAMMLAGVTAVAGAVGYGFLRVSAGRVEFLHPLAFLFLILPLAVFWGQTLWRSAFTRQIAYPFSHLSLSLFSLRAWLTRWMPLAFYTAAFLFMIAALARPVRVDRTLLPPTEGIDIILLMDVSASMQKQDFYPNRFIASQQTASRFIDKRLSDRIGLVVFAKSAMLQAPLTLDHESLQEYISSMYIGMVDPNYTAIGDALAVAANHLKQSKAKSKIIILLTDGDSNAGSIEPSLAAKAAAAYGIRVYAVGTASPPNQSVYASATDEINEGLMMEIAEATGGKFYRATNESELRKIYDTINALEKTTFSPSTIVSRKDVYQPLLFLALACVLLGLLTEKVLLIKVP